MIVRVTITQECEVERVPRTCSECPFADLCDGRVARLTKGGGMQWTAAAASRRYSRCPMVVEGE